MSSIGDVPESVRVGALSYAFGVGGSLLCVALLTPFFSSLLHLLSVRCSPKDIYSNCRFLLFSCLLLCNAFTTTEWWFRLFPRQFQNNFCIVQYISSFATLAQFTTNAILLVLVFYLLLTIIILKRANYEMVAISPTFGNQAWVKLFIHFLTRKEKKKQVVSTEDADIMNTTSAASEQRRGEQGQEEEGEGDEEVEHTNSTASPLMGHHTHHQESSNTNANGYSNIQEEEEEAEHASPLKQEERTDSTSKQQSGNTDESASRQQSEVDNTLQQQIANGESSAPVESSSAPLSAHERMKLPLSHRPLPPIPPPKPQQQQQQLQQSRSEAERPTYVEFGELPPEHLDFDEYDEYDEYDSYSASNQRTVVLIPTAPAEPEQEDDTEVTTMLNAIPNSIKLRGIPAAIHFCVAVIAISFLLCALLTTIANDEVTCDNCGHLPLNTRFQLLCLVDTRSISAKLGHIIPSAGLFLAMSFVGFLVMANVGALENTIPKVEMFYLFIGGTVTGALGLNFLHLLRVVFPTLSQSEYFDAFKFASLHLLPIAGAWFLTSKVLRVLELVHILSLRSLAATASSEASTVQREVEDTELREVST